jgi:hypothetical protein
LYFKPLSISSGYFCKLIGGNPERKLQEVIAVFEFEIRELAALLEYGK